MRPTWPMALVLVFNLVTVPSLCHASPLDPTWIAGLYDDADSDDVVLAVVVPPAEPPQVLAPISARKTLSAIVRAAPSKRRLTARVDRAPPLA